MSASVAWTAAALSWALTYAIHSSLLLGLAALVTRRLFRGDAWRETVWRGALVGSVLTATLATALPVEPLGGRFRIPESAVTRTAAPLPPSVVTVAGQPEAEAPVTTTPGPEVATRDDTRPGAATLRGGGGLGWASVLLLGWAATATVLLSLLLFRNVRLLRALRGRERLTDGPLPSLLAELRRRAGIWRTVALSVSDACPTPFVVGTSEICLPPRFLTDLDEGQQRAALAHELAHVRRRDPIWQLATAALNAILFFQPLNIVARRRLREVSEHLCDDWALRETGSPLALGRCLATVASWTAVRPLPHLEGTHAMAEGGSPLVQRIRRIAGGVPGSPELRLPAVVAICVLLLATAVGAPAAGPGPAVLNPSDEAGSPAGPTSDSSAASPAASDTLEVIRLLERLAMQDASPRVRQEAAAKLSDFQHPAAAAALMRIVRRAEDADVRAEAAQQLDEFPTDEVAAVLLEVVFEDPVDSVRFEAIDTLDDLADEFALAPARGALARLAAEHPLPEVRLEALDALSGDGG